MTAKITIILPSKNEGGSLIKLLPQLQQLFGGQEIIVVNDGSTDNTTEICKQLGVQIINHPYSMGNGAAIKSGARAATGEILIFMDSDNQHQPSDIPRLLAGLDKGYDMVIGARNAEGQASFGRFAANTLYNRLASWMVNQKIEDLTSGFRAVRAAKFREFLYLLPNGFSYPTTSTMAFFRAGYPVAYIPIKAEKRIGKSHINFIKDGVRFLLIIFKIGTLYSPLKLFFPVALLHALLGLSYYVYSYMAHGKLSLATIFLLTASVTIFLIGLVSEQITQLMYKSAEKDK